MPSSAHSTTNRKAGASPLIDRSSPQLHAKTGLESPRASTGQTERNPPNPWSFPYSPYITETPTADDSIRDPAFLSPPVSNDGTDRPPFKPVDADQTSLSMKRRHKRRKLRRRFHCASTGDAEDRRLLRRGMATRSLPHLKDFRRLITPPRLSTLEGRTLVDQKLYALHMARRKGSQLESSEFRRRQSLPRRPRRWTLPSKAPPSRVISESRAPAILSRTTPQHPRRGSRFMKSISVGLLSEKPPIETPAMIVLRRATNKRPQTAIRTDAIISFPPPVLTETKSSFVSSILNLTTGENTKHPPRQIAKSSASGSKPSPTTLLPPRQASISGNLAVPSCTVVAEPVYTELSVSPVWQRVHDEALETRQALDARRCSTKFISRTSVHEVIWDENVPSSGSEFTTAATSRRQTLAATDKVSGFEIDGRRQSVVVERLETQLEKCAEFDRRAPPKSQVRSPINTAQQQQQKSIQKMFSWQFGTSPSTNVDRVSVLPRSRGRKKKTVNHSHLDSAHTQFTTIDDPDEPSAHDNHIEFFPPLRARSLTTDSRVACLTTTSSSRANHADAEPAASAAKLQSLTMPPSPTAGREDRDHFDANRRASYSSGVVKLSPKRPKAGSALGQSRHLRKGSSNLTKGWHGIPHHGQCRDTADAVAQSESAPLLGEQIWGDCSHLWDGHDVDDDGGAQVRQRCCSDARKTSVLDIVGKIEAMRGWEKDIQRRVSCNGDDIRSKRTSLIVNQRSRSHALSDVRETETST